MKNALKGKHLPGGVGIRKGFLEEISYKQRVSKAEREKRKYVFLAKGAVCSEAREHDGFEELTERISEP